MFNWFTHHYRRLIGLAMFVGLFLSDLPHVGTKIPGYLETKPVFVAGFVILLLIYGVGYHAGQERHHEMMDEAVAQMEAEEGRIHD